MDTHANSPVDECRAVTTLARELGSAHETQRRKLGPGDLQQPLYFVQGVLRSAFIAEEVQSMHLDQRRTPNARVRSHCVERAFVRHAQRRLQIAVAHDVRNAMRTRGRVEKRPSPGDDTSIGITALIAYAWCNHNAGAGMRPRRFHRVVPHESW